VERIHNWVSRSEEDPYVVVEMVISREDLQIFVEK
jgi:hypothetical protein